MSRAMLRRLAPDPLSLAALVALVACASPGAPVFDVQVEATSNDGSAQVAGAVVLVRGEPVATTDALGRSLLHVPGQAGDRVPVSLSCPGASGAPAPAAELLLPGAPSASADETPALRLACPPAMHDAVVLVHASGGATSLPVKLDGAVIGHTDSLGFAHVHVRAGAPAQFDVSLDTSADPVLSPANPTQHFQLEHGDELFVFDTAFDAARPARKAARPATKPRRRRETND